MLDSIADAPKNSTYMLCAVTTLDDILITCSGHMLGIVEIVKFFPWGFGCCFLL